MAVNIIYVFDTSHLYSCGLCTTDTKARWIMGYDVEADWRL